MNKRAFTLVELLAVIAILGVIAAIFVPNAMKILSENKTKTYKVKENILINAAKDYTLYNRDFVFPTGDDAVYITANSLVEDSFMAKILDADSAEECNAFVKITVNATSGYDYSPCLLCTNYTTDSSFCTASTYSSI